MPTLVPEENFFKKIPVGNQLFGFQTKVFSLEMLPKLPNPSVKRNVTGFIMVEKANYWCQICSNQYHIIKVDVLKFVNLPKREQ